MSMGAAAPIDYQTKYTAEKEAHAQAEADLTDALKIIDGYKEVMAEKNAELAKYKSRYEAAEKDVTELLKINDERKALSEQKDKQIADLYGVITDLRAVNAEKDAIIKKQAVELEHRRTQFGLDGRLTLNGDIQGGVIFKRDFYSINVGYSSDDKLYGGLSLYFF
jgi:chromosome segregation ATPase